MTMTRSALTRLAVGATLGAALVATAGAAGAAPKAPTPAVALQDFVSGPTSPEDIIEVPDSGVAIVSGLSDDPLSTSSVGHLYAIDAASRAVTEIWPDRAWGVEWDQARFPSCPGAPNPAIASPHGINLEARADGAYDLYVVNHGGREGVEIFRLDVRNGVDLTWTGCVTMPAGTFANGVAPLPGGDGFVVTNFFNPTKSDPFSQIFSDTPSGNLMRWDLAAGWSVVEDSALAGPNGVVVTRDGRTAFVAEWGARMVHRIPLDRSRAAATSAIGRASVAVPFLPDNLRLSRQGEVLVTGQDYVAANVIACQANDLANCPTGLHVIAVDPKRMTSRTLYAGDPANFRAPTVAAPVGDSIWVGAVKGARIAVLD
ncbi:SMP-30/gluconolactonase/LRE family protein [Knoellia sp. CPCC 206435]|uniref:SMP-30/gluconolactonase/LRE family protein n=1 Tax=Knoellia terrae TaxID=3404797 RepID=UPI003B43A2D7